MKDFKQFKKEILRDKELKREYNLLAWEFNLVAQLTEQRIKKGLTQRELAKLLGTKQSAISRFETGRVRNPSITFVRDLAAALGGEFSIVIK